MVSSPEGDRFRQLVSGEIVRSTHDRRYRPVMGVCFSHQLITLEMLRDSWGEVTKGILPPYFLNHFFRTVEERRAFTFPLFGHREASKKIELSERLLPVAEYFLERPGLRGAVGFLWSGLGHTINQPKFELGSKRKRVRLLDRLGSSPTPVKGVMLLYYLHVAEGMVGLEYQDYLRKRQIPTTVTLVYQSINDSF
jgi:hypothetical protein